MINIWKKIEIEIKPSSWMYEKIKEKLNDGDDNDDDHEIII